MLKQGHLHASKQNHNHFRNNAEHLKLAVISLHTVHDAATQLWTINGTGPNAEHQMHSALGLEAPNSIPVLGIFLGATRAQPKSLRLQTD